MNYPQLCSKCKEKLFGFVQYCPFCGLSSPLIELQVHVPVVDDAAAEDNLPQKSEPIIVAEPESDTVYHQQPEPARDNEIKTSKREVERLKAEPVNDEPQEKKEQEETRTTIVSPVESIVKDNKTDSQLQSVELTSHQKGKGRRNYATQTIGNAFQVADSNVVGETTDSHPVEVSPFKQDSPFISALFKSSTPHTVPGEGPLKSDEPEVKKNDSKRRSKLKSSDKISSCFLNESDKSKE
jgi:hypothetical protein